MDVLLLVIALIVVAVLAGYAVYLHWLLRKQKKEQAQLRHQQKVQAKEQRQRVNESIQILAQGCARDELTLTEASIRIRVLLDSLSVSDETREEFSAFYQLAAATEHMPILEEWKKQDRKTKARLTLEREQLELQYGDFVLAAAKKIAGRQF